MPIFRYRAYNNAGGTVAGDIEAAGLKDAVQKIKDGGLYPVDVSEAEGRKKGFLKPGRINSQLLALTTRQLATLLSTGSNLSEALGVISENSSNARLKSIILKIKERVSQGSSFARALEEHPELFTAFYRGLVASGEATGSLDKVLPRLADYLEARARIIRDVKSALTYPALMTAVGIAVLSFLFIFVIPKITRMFEDTETSLPFITVVLIAVTDAVRNYWYAIIGALGALAWFLRKELKTRRGKAFADRVLLSIPWFGTLVSDFYVSNLARTLGSLLKGGVQMLKALEITKEALNHDVYGSVLDEAIEDCTGGASLSASLKKSDAIPPIVTHMISVGERGGNLDEMLLKTADTYEQELESGIKRALHLIEPVLILVMGLVVGFIVLAILLPIFELNQAIR